jgi:hypothetical protein
VQGIVSTPGFCKFSAWKRESDLPRQPFSGWLLSCLAAHPPARTWIKDISTGRSIAFGEVRGHVDRIAKVSTIFYVSRLHFAMKVHAFHMFCWATILVIFTVVADLKVFVLWHCTRNRLIKDQF